MNILLNIIKQKKSKLKVNKKVSEAACLCAFVKLCNADFNGLYEHMPLSRSNSLLFSRYPKRALEEGFRDSGFKPLNRPEIQDSNFKQARIRDSNFT